MLSSQYRLRKEADISRVYKKGKGVFDTVCGIKWKENEKDFSRFAVVVGKKVSKKAVDRNKIRRQYRSIIKEFLVHLPKNIDVVLLVSADALALSYEEKSLRLQSVFEKGKLFSKEV